MVTEAAAFSLLPPRKLRKSVVLLAPLFINMIKLYKTTNKRVYDKLKSLLNTNAEIKRGKNGKPYIDGFEFSVTHTGDTALIAISDEPVGIDAEIIKTRGFLHILKRFTHREQAEIGRDAVKFLKNWVVKEAYIKMLGGTLAQDFRRLEYFENTLLCDEVKPDCNILCASSNGLIYAVCAKSEITENLGISNI